MVGKSDYNLKLSQAFSQAESIVQAENVDEAIFLYKKAHSALAHPLKTLEENGNEVALGKTVAEGLETLINNFGQNKYLYSILITSCVEKLVHPNQDIRYAQDRLSGGYSNRSTDAAHVTPFLKRHGLTSCAASGAESGRNFEKPYPYTLNNELNEVMQTVKQIRQHTGCQVIVNGLNQSLRYYLRLVSAPNKFLTNYTEQVQTDLDVKDEHRQLWAQILDRLVQ